MSEKRYAIVRVDNKCPMSTEGFNAFTCEDLFRCGYLWQLGQDTDCKDFCRYGDTKEQLIRKVAQVIKRVTNDGYVIAYKKFGTGYINTVLKNTDVAKEIVEFLGVEDDKGKEKK